MDYLKTKKVDWRSPGFRTEELALYIDPDFDIVEATEWCEENCIKRFYIFGEALMISWNFEAEIDCILFKLNWKRDEREYYMILRNENDNSN